MSFTIRPSRAFPPRARNVPARPAALALALAVALLVLTAMAALPAPARAADKPLVFVSILPQRYFVSAIAQDLVDVEVMVAPGAGPATYEPTPGQMASLARAKAYFAIGVPFEAAWLERFASANPAMPIVHAEQGIHKQPMAVHEHGKGHDQGQGDHHGILDPHVWLSPVNARTLAQNTCRGLADMDPAHAATYRANLAALLQDLSVLDADIRTFIEAIPESRRAFMVFHPAWGYFARDYGLRQIPIEAEGKEPGPRQLADIVRRGREMGISAVFVQPQFSEKSARVIASEMGAAVVPMDPLAEDWNANLRAAAQAFGKALR